MCSTTITVAFITQISLGYLLVPVDPRPPDPCDRFHLYEQIGSGKHSTVYKARRKKKIL